MRQGQPCRAAAFNASLRPVSLGTDIWSATPRTNPPSSAPTIEALGSRHPTNAEFDPEHPRMPCADHQQFLRWRSMTCRVAGGEDKARRPHRTDRGTERPRAARRSPGIPGGGPPGPAWPRPCLAKSGPGASRSGGVPSNNAPLGARGPRCLVRQKGCHKAVRSLDPRRRRTKCKPPTPPRA
jgi:hypothetical protein